VNRRVPILLLLVSTITAPARAHQGPPFPILVDQRVGPYVASVWTDPDIGIGTFFVVLEPPDGEHALPVGTRVRIGVQPVSKRLPEIVYAAKPQPVHYGQRHFAEVKLDRGERWRIRVLIAGPRGGGQLTSEVEATPNGTLGPIGSLVYLFPFLAVGFLWLKAALRKRESAKEGTAGLPT
jgi:hypothetical protein